MTALYVFSLVLGGGFLALSLLGDLLGGHGDVDVAAGSDVDLGGHDVDASGDAGHATAKIFSIRTVTYSLFGFGAVGTLVGWLNPAAPAALTLVLAGATGLASGWLINTTFAWVRRSESGVVEAEDAFAGHVGRVTLPIEGAGGRVVVERAGREVELRAVAHPSARERGDPAEWRHVVVVEMDGGVAHVAPVDDEPMLNP